MFPQINLQVARHEQENLVIIIPCHLLVATILQQILEGVCVCVRNS